MAIFASAYASWCRVVIATRALIVLTHRVGLLSAGGSTLCRTLSDVAVKHVVQCSLQVALQSLHVQIRNGLRHQLHVVSSIHDPNHFSKATRFQRAATAWPSTAGKIACTRYLHQRQTAGPWSITLAPRALRAAACAPTCTAACRTTMSDLKEQHVIPPTGAHCLSAERSV